MSQFRHVGISCINLNNVYILIVTSVTFPQFFCQFISFYITLGRNREGGKVKEEGISERDEGSEREINPPTLELKQSTAMRGNTLDVGAGGSWLCSEGEDRISKAVNHWDTYSVLRTKDNS